MNFENLKIKALNKEIKLEDLDVEDILKFNTLGFLNPTLKQYFGLSQSQIDKTRKQKKLTNAMREDCIRNIIALMDYNVENTNMSLEELKYTVIIPYALSLHDIRPKKENNYELILSMDLEHINIKKEIESKKIDVDFRLKNIFEGMPELKNLYHKYKTSKLKSNTSFINRNEPVKTKEITKKIYIPNDKQLMYKQGPKRNPKISENALKEAKYLCEIDSTHKTFIKKSTKTNYMEPHHLIPLEFQEYFKYSLDVEPNIISLCSYCHDEIHYGINNTFLITKLYYERIEELKKVGLDIDLETLFLFYEYKRKQLENIINIEEYISQNN